MKTIEGEVLTKEEAEREFRRSKEYEEVQLDLFIKTYKEIQDAGKEILHAGQAWRT